jgi:leucine-zipper-like transcriptional regulator 1
LGLIKEYCLSYIVKDDHFNDIVMSPKFDVLEKALLVEIIRKKIYVNPAKHATVDMKYDKTIGTTLENDMAAFLKSSGKEFCDINLILDGKTIPSHKSILAARCQYFQSMFRSFMPPDNTVNVRICCPIKCGPVHNFFHFRFKSVRFRRPTKRLTHC